MRAVDAGIQQRLEAIHADLRQDMAAIARLAVALYEPSTGSLRSFAHSTDGRPPFVHVASRLDDEPALAELARARAERVIADVGADADAGPRSLALRAAGYRSSFTTPFYDRGALAGFVFLDAAEAGYFDGARRRHAGLYAHLVALVVIDALRSARVLRSAVDVARAFGRFRDQETGAHLDRMAHYARLIATALAAQDAIDDEFVEFVFVFAPLHDIGKIAIADSILLKPGRLTEAEFATMQLHVTEGARIVDTIVSSFGMTAAQHVDILRNIVRCHHEWWNGEGYPAGLRGEAIPIEARIVSVADVFDALTTVRPYKPAYDNERAFAMLREAAGRQFEPRCVEALIADRAAAEQVQARFAAAEGLHEAYNPEL